MKNLLFNLGLLVLLAFTLAGLSGVAARLLRRDGHPPARLAAFGAACAALLVLLALLAWTLPPRGSHGA
jgi:drug/metabolite transporter (DMT)-like permease